MTGSKPVSPPKTGPEPKVPSSRPALPEEPWTASAEEVLAQLAVSIESGLTEEEADSRRRLFGANRLREVRAKSPWRILADQFKGLIVALLALAALVAFLFDDWVEGLAITAVIAINGLIGFFTELRAVRSMEALRSLGVTQSTVRRDGKARQISAEELVPGDLVVLESGDAITADLRLIEASKFQVNESTLTGESTPVGKNLEPVPEETPLAERSNLVFKGTFVTRGSGLGIVVRTGMDTELGTISSLVEEAGAEEKTPLEKRLDALGGQLVWVTLAITAIVAVLGWLRGKGLILMIETAVALAVAAIPEGLPIVATIALARGMLRMARKNALIRRLGAVETLGATNVIFTDKTGTLTENQMTVVRILVGSGEAEIEGVRPRERSATPDAANGASEASPELIREALEIGLLCNNASLNGEEGAAGVGDPMEVALLVAGKSADLEQERLREEWPEEREVAFDPDVKMMATFHAHDGSYRVAVKGAPETILEHSAGYREKAGEWTALDARSRSGWLERSERMAAEGLRVLALATKSTDDLHSEPYRDLILVALVGIMDPPRQDVRKAIEECQRAGIRVVMVTGDQAVTASTIARETRLVKDESESVVLGHELEAAGAPESLADTAIFARVSPRQKLALIENYQQRGAIVAMTGDGVNDAPALEKADIGIAMGRRGTQVAREASDMILQDDAFPTIVAAIEQGRVIFGNIRKFVMYLLSCNVSEIAVVGLASVAGAPLPLLPLQILFLNLVTDVFPALALGVGEGGRNVMDEAPRDPREPVLPARLWWRIAGSASLITISVLLALWLARSRLELDLPAAVTVSFLTLSMAQLWHVFNMRDRGGGVFRNEITRNPYIWVALSICLGLLGLALFTPFLTRVLQLAYPGNEGLILALGMSLVPWFGGALFHLSGRTRRSRRKNRFLREQDVK